MRTRLALCAGSVYGRHDVFFDALRVTRGETYRLEIAVTNCGPWFECRSKPLGDMYRPFTLDFTTTDAYPDGAFDWNYGPMGPDIRFQATFAVPEPGSLLLLLTGMAGLFVVARRRRRTVD